MRKASKQSKTNGNGLNKTGHRSTLKGIEKKAHMLKSSLAKFVIAKRAKAASALALGLVAVTGFFRSYWKHK